MAQAQAPLKRLGPPRPQEFIRVGYYVNSEYVDEELRDNPPEVVDITRVQRSILADKPRVTRFQIEFDAMSMARRPPHPPPRQAAPPFPPHRPGPLRG